MPIKQLLSSAFRRPNCTTSVAMLKHLNQREAIELDQDLFNDYHFDVVQLMELAGLSCAHAIAKCFPPSNSSPNGNRVLVLCGPGNNGGDGLVCARHLSLLGFKPLVVYPRSVDKQPFVGLVKQLHSSDIRVQQQSPTVAETNVGYDLIVDALFGFSFKPPVRPDYADVMQVLRSADVPVAR